jgi:iron complex outermembrane recepter protein
MFTLYFLVISLLVAGAVVAQQDGEVAGRVIDAATGDGLSGVNITNGRGGAVSGEEGRFTLQYTTGDSLEVSHVGYRPVIVPAADTLTVQLARDLLRTDEIVVTGGIEARTLEDVAAGVTVLAGEDLAGAVHIQDLVAAVPNLNWAGGTARPRYFQVRGIGERSQYAGEGAPNFSVGFVVDDIELSGLGAGALTDMAQVEVFKGPQSAAFGPNALAGMVHMASTDPGPVASRSVAVEGGSDALLRYSAAINAPLGERLAFRLALQQARSNGFRDNRFLDKDDTNRRRETLLRLKGRYVGPGGLVLLGTLLRLDADNGYDMWSPDNNKDLFSYADNPGVDHQETDAFSLRATWPLSRTSEVVAITGLSRTDLEYSFDGDWGNDVFWARQPYGFDPEVEGWNYDFFDRTLRRRDTFTQELRFLQKGLPGSGEAVVGAYFKRTEEKDRAVGYLFGGDAGDLRGRFEVEDAALYGQYALPLSERLYLRLNLRGDRNAIDYGGVTNGGAEVVDFDVSEWLLGGKAALSYDWRPGRSFFGAVSRGFRAGGVNQHPFLAAESRPYDPEYILNFETGIRLVASHYRAGLTLFHARRSDQQVSLSSQQDPGDPNSFFFFVANATSGHNSGLEFEGDYRLRPDLRLFGSLAYLKTQVDAYSFDLADGSTQILGDRAAAHAPEYTARLGAAYDAGEGIFGRIEWSASDEFYFSDSHDQVGQAYQLFNGSVGYHHGKWRLTLWGRNLLDERYAVRGFFFGLEPPDYPETLYLSYGDPRQVGLSAALDF